ncbi:hypothetical protein CDAR_77101 [Caerostris darwini]|uniref:Uncharacterized protein n=1 Tax=Caerostris darwini TaxID=1538125 RepID=A0AAV4W641_9ARAC|nr:hypothetical protein CDAR_577001 [Caerostris darwini]GIY84021.1 hypothetical protein CDAR_77101 [Caerostris darwini]
MSFNFNHYSMRFGAKAMASDHPTYSTKLPICLHDSPDLPCDFVSQLGAQEFFAGILSSVTLRTCQIHFHPLYFLFYSEGICSVFADNLQFEFLQKITIMRLFFNVSISIFYLGYFSGLKPYNKIYLIV